VTSHLAHENFCLSVHLRLMTLFFPPVTDPHPHLVQVNPSRSVRQGALFASSGPFPLLLRDTTSLWHLKTFCFFFLAEPPSFPGSGSCFARVDFPAFLSFLPLHYEQINPGFLSSLNKPSFGCPFSLYDFRLDPYVFLSRPRLSRAFLFCSGVDHCLCGCVCRIRIPLFKIRTLPFSFASARMSRRHRPTLTFYY